MLAYAGGDAASFERLYARHRGRLPLPAAAHVEPRDRDELHQTCAARVRARERIVPKRGSRPGCTR